MVKNLIVETWCDVCDAEGIETPATTTPPITIGTSHASKPKTVDLCERHYAERFEAFRVMVGEFGVLVKKDEKASRSHHRREPDADAKPSESRERRGKSAEGPFLCEWPGCTSQRVPSKNLASFGMHLYQRHQSNLTAYREKVGEPRTVDPHFFRDAAAAAFVHDEEEAV